MTPIGEKRVHWVFFWSLLLKAIMAAVELSFGILLAVVSIDWLSAKIGWMAQSYVNTEWLNNIIDWVTPDRIILHPNDMIASYLFLFAENLSIGTKLFAAIYAIVNGVIKLFLFVELLREKMWIFKPAIFALSAFVVYQFYRYFFVTHEPALLVFASFDIIVIGLIWHTYGELRQK